MDYITLPPSPKSTIQALREIGYTLKTAIADLIDNSITWKAKNIWIEAKWDQENSFISILDDGEGMTEKVLKDAMRPGTKDPDDKRKKDDLGRYSLGLKTASWSQAEKLFVWSKSEKDKIHSLGWDLTEVFKRDEWAVAKNLPDPDEINKLEKQKSGTLIKWENLKKDSVQQHQDNGRAKALYYDLIQELEEYLGMIFHRFIEKQKLKIIINNNEIKAWDPFFASTSLKPSLSPTEEIKFAGEIVRIKGYVLPHKDNFIKDEGSDAYERAGGPNGWLSQQGFYLYRADRLIVSGGWLDMKSGGKKFDNEPQYELARISIDIPNSLDKEWSLDLKKSTAEPPLTLKNKIQDQAIKVREDAKKAFVARGKYGPRPGKEIQQTEERVWNVKHHKDNISYIINKKHPAVNGLASKLGVLSDELESTLKIIEQCVPVQQIWLDSQGEGDHQIPFAGMEKELKKDLLELKNCLLRKHDSATVKKILLGSEPYNRYPSIIDKVMES